MRPLPNLKVALLLLVAAVLMGTGAMIWAQGTSSDAQKRYDELVLSVPQEDELNQKLAESQTKVSETRSQLQHLELSVPGLAYVPTLLTEMENLGKQHHIEVTGVRPVIDNKVVPKNTDDKTSGTEKKPDYEQMSIDITGRGSYADVMAMVESIKKFPKIIAIQTIGLVPKRESGADATTADPNKIVLDATIRIKAYLFPIVKSETQKPSRLSQSSSSTGGGSHS